MPQSARSGDMGKSIAAYGLGNAIVDTEIQLDRESLSSLGLTPGSFARAASFEADAIIKSCKHFCQETFCGGSVANSIVAIARLGASAGFGGPTGDDSPGERFRSELLKTRVTYTGRTIMGARTGAAVVLVTPDGERTIVAAPNVATHFGEGDISKPLIEASRWLLIESYLLGHGAVARGVIESAIRAAHESGARIAVSTSSLSVVQKYRKEILEIAKLSDLIIASWEEGLGLVEAVDIDKTFKLLRDYTPNCVLTLGEEGALVRFDRSEIRIPAPQCKVIDTNGAGDAFAGAFLYSISRGDSVQAAAELAARVAADVACSSGARYRGTMSGDAEQRE